jgi:regulator of protease activity HflC (stomatin/prohibitin superfamily)
MINSILIFSVIVVVASVLLGTYFFLKISELKTLRNEKKDLLDSLNTRLTAWKAKLEKGEAKPEDDLRYLNLQIKDLRKQIIAFSKEGKEEEVKKNEKLLEAKEKEYAKYLAIFHDQKDGKISSLEIEEKSSMVEMIIEQISGYNLLAIFWISWIIISAVVSLLGAYLVYFGTSFFWTQFADTLAIIFLYVFFAGVQFATIVYGYTAIPQKKEYLISWFGKHLMIWTPGLAILSPVGMEVDAIVYMGDKSIDLDLGSESGEVSEDANMVIFSNATAKVTATVFFRIFSSKKAIYEAENLVSFIKQKMEAGIRAYYGKMTLEDAIEGRAEVDLRQIIIQEATEAGLFKGWGIKITSLAIKDIIPPKSIRDIRQKVMEEEKAREVAQLQIETEKAKAQISKIKGSAEALELKEFAALLGFTTKDAVEYRKFMEHQKALGNAGVLISGGSETAGQAAIAGAVAGATKKTSS